MQLAMLLWLHTDRGWVHGSVCCGLDQANIHVSCMGAKTVRGPSGPGSRAARMSHPCTPALRSHIRAAPLTCCRSRNALLLSAMSAAGSDSTQLKQRCGLCNAQAAADEAPMGREHPPGPAKALAFRPQTLYFGFCLPPAARLHDCFSQRCVTAPDGCCGVLRLGEARPPQGCCVHRSVGALGDWRLEGRQDARALCCSGRRSQPRNQCQPAFTTEKQVWNGSSCHFTPWSQIKRSVFWPCLALLVQSCSLLRAVAVHIHPHFDPRTFPPAAPPQAASATAYTKHGTASGSA